MPGFAYTWNDLSLTFAPNEIDAIEADDNDAAREYSKFGSINLAWRGG